MRRGLVKFAPPSSAAFCTFSGAGGATGGAAGSAGSGGSGRGRGRGVSPPPILGQPPSSSDEDPFLSSAVGRGRGRGGAVVSGDVPQPTFPSFLPSAGRGRDTISPNPKKPIFFSRDDEPSFTTSIPGSGRGKPINIPKPVPTEPVPEPVQENRHLKRREEAQKRAMEVLSKGLSRGGPARGAGPSRGGGRGGRGRGRFGGRGAMEKEKEAADLSVYLGDNSAGERLEKKFGEEKMKILEEAFEEATRSNLPSPAADAYRDAQHLNNMIEYEREYMVNFDNPDIDEKPPMTLEEVLQKCKPFLIAYEGMQSNEEWEEAVKEVMGRLPEMEKMIEAYAGPDVITAKQQHEELQRVADNITSNVPNSVKRFADRAILSLQSNPGWAFDKKWIFMDKLAVSINKQYK